MKFRKPYLISMLIVSATTIAAVETASAAKVRMSGSGCLAMLNQSTEASKLVRNNDNVTNNGTTNLSISCPLPNTFTATTTVTPFVEWSDGSTSTEVGCGMRRMANSAYEYVGGTQSYKTTGVASTLGRTKKVLPSGSVYAGDALAMECILPPNQKGNVYHYGYE